jgi:hypothetical protein
MKRLAAFVVAIAVGIALAMLIGWVLFPMPREEYSPASMRADYQVEYLRLVAIAYGADGDLALAQQRLRALGEEPFTAPLVEVTELWIREGRGEELIVPFVRLADALDVLSPEMVPYLDGGEG